MMLGISQMQFAVKALAKELENELQFYLICELRLWVQMKFQM